MAKAKTNRKEKFKKHVTKVNKKCIWKLSTRALHYLKRTDLELRGP